MLWLNKLYESEARGNVLWLNKLYKAEARGKFYII
jgi:hypothetical protein